jgi:hypothetical protein
MIECRSGPRLALETLSRSLTSKGLRQNFNGYVAMESRVPGLIYLAHATLADRRKDFVRPKSLAG